MLFQANDINDNAAGKPGYGGYGWRWCAEGDVAVECEKFCESLCVPYPFLDHLCTLPASC